MRKRLLVPVTLTCWFLATAVGLAQDKPAKPPSKPQPFSVEQFLQKHDKNKDGFLDRSECPERLLKHFDRIDTNKDGKLSKEELQKVADHLERMFGGTGAGGKGRPGSRPGEIITPAARGERKADTLKVGDLAPDFTLPLHEGKGEVTLSSFQKQRPVVLVFASYT